MKNLIIATRNQNKFKEMEKALSGLGWFLKGAFEFHELPEIPEDGRTLEENSFKKAKVISGLTRLPALADDTGLFVDVLRGQPGIYSARFAGENCTYDDNVKKLLEMLKNVEIGKRTAIFRTVITIYYPEKTMEQVTGEIAGIIATEPLGNQGFGYDPVFIPVGFSKAFAEMSLEEKNMISHRGLALQKARGLLKNS
jgi:XTP/dITP diphosphohydrolase